MGFVNVAISCGLVLCCLPPTQLCFTAAANVEPKQPGFPQLSTESHRTLEKRVRHRDPFLAWLESERDRQAELLWESIEFRLDHNIPQYTPNSGAQDEAEPEAESDDPEPNTSAPPQRTSASDHDDASDDGNDGGSSDADHASAYKIHIQLYRENECENRYLIHDCPQHEEDDCCTPPDNESKNLEIEAVAYNDVNAQNSYLQWDSGGDCDGTKHLATWPDEDDGDNVCFDLYIVCRGSKACLKGSASFEIKERARRKLKKRGDALSSRGAGMAPNSTSKTQRKGGPCRFTPMTLYQHDNSANTTWTLPITTLEMRKDYESNKLPPASASFGAFELARIALLKKFGARQFADPRTAILAAKLYHLDWTKKHAGAKQWEEGQCSAAET